MELFIESWQAGRLRIADDQFLPIFNGVRDHFNTKFREALSCMDMDQLDKLKALSDRCLDRDRGALELRLMTPDLAQLLVWHGRHMLEFAIKIGDRKGLASTLIASERYCDHTTKGDDRDAVDLFFKQAREQYQEKLLKDVNKVLLTDAGKELLGDNDAEGMKQNMIDQQMQSRFVKLNPRVKDEVESEEFLRSVQALFDLSGRTVLTRDRHDKLPRRMEVVRVKRSVNMTAYKSYFARREEIRESMTYAPKADIGNVDGTSTIPLTGSWTPMAVKRALGVWHEKDSNKWWLLRADGSLVDVSIVILTAVVSQLAKKISKDQHLIQCVVTANDEDGSSLWMRATMTADCATASSPTLLGQLSDDEDTLIWEPPKDASPDQPQVLADALPADASLGPPQRRVWTRAPRSAGSWFVGGKHALILPQACYDLVAGLLPSKERQLLSTQFENAFAFVEDKGERAPDQFMYYRQSLHPIWLEAFDKRKVESWLDLSGDWKIWKNRVITAQIAKIGVDGTLLLAGKQTNVKFETQVDQPPVIEHSDGEWSLDFQESTREMLVWNKRGADTSVTWSKRPFQSGFAIRSIVFCGSVDLSGRELCLEPLDASAKRGSWNTALLDGETWGHRLQLVAELSAKELSAQCKELWLFHGTTDEAAESITDDDFRIKLAGSHRGTMFGPGVYLADSVTKSDEYTEEDSDGLRTIILCRCVMGCALPQQEGGRRCIKNCQQGGYHSVRGDRAYTEFVVYDENQVYAEYLVWYRHLH